MKYLIAIVTALFLTACGSNVQHTQSGLEHEQKIVLIADQLVGLTISVGKVANHTIVKSDLTPYKTGVAGAADAADENKQILSIKVDKGNHKLSIQNAHGTTILAKELYLASGQIRTIRL
ncbi:hypothetical protein [Shewanella maritima]|uniref:hypothetical protein n=1 Tax=Shewanella maritima TaxID=2520507 RepID=UPI003736D21A